MQDIQDKVAKMAATQTGLHLNADILVMLTDFLEDRRSVLSLMNTCHLLYSAGIPKLLSFPVWLSHEQEFSSFCEFMLADLNVRPRYLRDLTVGSTAYISTDRLVRSFVQVLSQTGGLQKFSITCDNDPWEVSVVAALSSLTTITHLSIDSPNAQTIQILRRWRSRLVEVDVSFDETHLMDKYHTPEDIYNTGYVDPLWIFAPFRTSIREMHVHWPRFFSSTNGPVQFPALETLQLHAFPPASTSGLMHAFPALRRLLASFEQSFDLEDLERARSANQLELEDPERNTAGDWESLEFVQGDVGSVFVCSLPCRVRQLDLTVPHRCHNSDVLLSTILATAQPNILALHFFENSAKLESLKAALSTASAVVTHLDVAYHVVAGDMHVSYVVNDIMSLLQRLPSLRELTLSVQWFRSLVSREEAESSGEPSRSQSRSPAPQNDVEAYLTSCDLEALARRVVDIVPSLSLEKIVLNFTQNGKYEWCVEEGPDGGQILTLVSESPWKSARL